MFFKYTFKKLVRDIKLTIYKANPDLIVEYHSEHNLISVTDPTVPDETSTSVYLTNLFNKLKDRSATERRSILESTVEDIFSKVVLSTDELITSMFLRVRTDNELYIRRCFIELDGHEMSPPILFGDKEPYLELILDNDESISTASLETLSDSDISLDEASAIAHANMARATDANQWQLIAKDTWLSSYQDDHDLARVIAAGDELRLPFDGDAILFAPSHSICLITNNQSNETLNQMIELGYQYAENHRPLSSRLWLKQPSKKWQDWSAISENRVARLQMFRGKDSSYQEQKIYMERLLEKRGEDSFVASYQVFEKDGDLKSLCVYSMDLPSYLPKTDVVALYLPDEPEEDTVRELLWDDFAKIFGDDLKAFDDSMLPRFGLLTKPSVSQRKALLAATELKVN